MDFFYFLLFAPVPFVLLWITAILRVRFDRRRRERDKLRRR